MKLFYRKIYEQLKDWKKKYDGKRSLLIEGARRIGKSTICKEFATNEYKSYIFIDFNKASNNVKNAFEDYLNDLDNFFLILSAEYNVKLYPRESLIILDEIQKFPRARECTKYLVEDGRFDYIATGSLISIHGNTKDITIPSEEKKILMYPMDFEEFAKAMGEDQLLEFIRHSFNRRQALPDALHAKAMFLLRKYMIIGGMPQSISAFINSGGDFHASDSEKRSILDLYREDIMKISNKYRTNVLTIFDQIPAFLSQGGRRIILNKIEKGATFPKYNETFLWLADSMITNQCFNCLDPNVGISLNEDRTYVKCYMGDTGLLLAHTFDETILQDGELYREILFNKLSTNEGMFYENLISQMLVASGHKLFFYVKYSNEKHKNDIEIDFLISTIKYNYKITPVEVKSSDRYTIKSLEKFKDLYKERIQECIVIHPKNLTEKDGILKIPAYMTFCL